MNINLNEIFCLDGINSPGMTNADSPAIFLAHEELKRRGRKLEATDIPGLYRIDDGPELTTGQVLSIVWGPHLPSQNAL